MIKVLESQIVKIPQESLKKGVVILGIEEYRKMRKAAIPTCYLAGRAAKDIDELVEYGLEEHEKGKTIKASSMGEALKIYDKEKNKER